MVSQTPYAVEIKYNLAYYGDLSLNLVQQHAYLDTSCWAVGKISPPFRYLLGVI